MDSRGMTRREARARLEREQVAAETPVEEAPHAPQESTAPNQHTHAEPPTAPTPTPEALDAAATGTVHTPSSLGDKLRAVATGVGATLAIAFIVAAAIHYTSQPAPMPGADYGDSSEEAPAEVAPPAVETTPEPGSPFSIVDPAPALASAGQLKVLVMGDSVAGNMYHSLRDHRSADLALTTTASGGCGLFDATKARAGNGWVMDSEEKGCWEWKDDLRGMAPGEQPDVILVHNKWDVEDQLFEDAWIGPCQDVWDKRYQQQLELLAEITDGFGTPPLILMSDDRPRDWSKTVSPERLACKAAVEERIFAAHPNVQRLDLSGAVCPDDLCVTDVTPGQPLYADDRVHFTPAAKQVMAPWLENQIAAGLSTLGRL